MQFTGFGQERRFSRLITPQIVKTMKLLPFFLIMFFASLHARTNAQQITYSVKDGKLKDALAALEKQSGMVFFSASEDIAKAKPVSVEINKESLEKALEKVMKDQPLEYIIKGNTVFIKAKELHSKPQVLQEFNSTVVPFNIDIRGRVVNEKGEPIPGISVLVKGTKRGTSTDENGIFTINGLSEDAVLQFSGVNIEAYETAVKGRTELNVTAKAKVSTLQDVEITSVNTGYQAIPKERATGAFTTIDNQAINRRVSTNVLDRLEGIAPGILFNKTARADLNEPAFSLRGKSTIYASTDPLIVVDNFPYTGDLSSLNPDDVETITLLKDAAAASIWGARSGNGVVVITTKKGKYNQALKVEFNSNLTLFQKNNLYTDRAFIQSSDFVEIERSLYNSGYFNTTIANTNNANTALSPVIEILKKKANGTLSAADAENQLNDLKNYDVRDDLSSYFYQSAVNQHNSLSLRAGTQNTNYSLSISYDNNVGGQVNNSNNRFTINSLFQTSPVKNLEFSVGVNYVQAKNIQDNTLSQIRMSGSYGIYPYARLADGNGNPVSIVKDLNVGYVASAPNSGFLDWSFSPLDELRRKLNQTINDRIDSRIIGGFKYGLNKSLSIDVKGYYQKSTLSVKSDIDGASYASRSMVNRFSSVNANKVVNGYNIPVGGIVDYNDAQVVTQNLRAQINYGKSFRLHSFDALAGVEVTETKTTSKSSRLYGFNKVTGANGSVNYLSSFPTNPSSSAFIPFQDYVNGTTDRFRSYYANFTYGFDKKYFLSASARIDQSNLFGVKANQKSIPLSTLGFKWMVSNESFYGFKWLPNLSIRATYGSSGNANKSVSAFTVLRYYSSVDILGTSFNTADLSTIGNPELKWERVNILNVGLDFSSKNGRISGSLEIFDKRGSDVLGVSLLPSSSGFTFVVNNSADISNKGYEISLTSKNIDREFKWVTKGIITKSKDRIERYAASQVFAPVGNLVLTTQEGWPLSPITGLSWAGLDPLTGDPRGYLNNQISTDYRSLILLPITQRTLFGSTIPTLFGSIMNTFQYKQFSISFNVVGKFGYFFRPNTLNINSLFGNYLMNADYYRRWVKPGDELLTNIPSINYSLASTQQSRRNSFFAQSEATVSKADHIRLQDIGFDYRLGVRSTSLFKTPTIYGYLNNIGVLWTANKQNIDPDFQSGRPPIAFSIGFRTSF